MSTTTMSIEIPAHAWDVGFLAGLRGADPLRCPYDRETPEALAFYSGYIEGKAERLSRRAANDLAAPIDA